MAENGVAKVAELVERATICMLTTMTADGRHMTRPMALQEVEFDGDLWFFAARTPPRSIRFSRTLR
jgi:general stress protein 26